MESLTIIFSILLLSVVVLFLSIYLELYEFAKINDSKISFEDYLDVLKKVNKKQVLKNWMSLNGKDKTYIEFIKEFKNILLNPKLLVSEKTNITPIFEKSANSLFEFVVDMYDEEIRLTKNILFFQDILEEKVKEELNFDERNFFSKLGKIYKPSNYSKQLMDEEEFYETEVKKTNKLCKTMC